MPQTRICGISRFLQRNKGETFESLSKIPSLQIQHFTWMAAPHPRAWKASAHWTTLPRLSRLDVWTDDPSRRVVRGRVFVIEALDGSMATSFNR